MTNSQQFPVTLHSMNRNLGTRTQHILNKTSATAADLQYNPAPDHPQNPQLISPPFSLKSDAFWTLCNRCRTRYEYSKMYLNQKLLCHHCQQPFMAIENPAQSANVCSSRPWPAMFAASKDSRSVPASSTMPIETTTMVHPSGQSPKEGPKGAVIMVRDDKTLEKNAITPKKVDASSAFNAGSPHLKAEKSPIKRRIDGPKYTNKGSRVITASKSGHKRKPANLKGNFGAEQVVISNSNKPRGWKELSLSNICSMLMEKARKEIIRELNK